MSVIMPCYNQGIYLPEALESIISQTYPKWECIIINDGSIALLKIDARLDNDNAASKIKDYESLKRESESKIIDLNLEIISKNEEIIELKEENKLAEEEIKNLKKELELSNERIEELYTELLNDIGDYDFNFKLETCPKCGAVVGEDSNYCVECGSKL